MVGSTPIVVLPEGLVEKVGRHPLRRASAAAVRHGVNDISELTESGDAAEVIVEQAKKRRIDLIVIGRRSFDDLKSIFLGSVSHKVAQECECPCVMVK